MTNCLGPESLNEDVKDIIRRHTNLTASKLVSYLPLNTVQNVMGICLETYIASIEKNGGSYLIFREDECCIASGAVYAFLQEDLSRVLSENQTILAEVGISSDPTEFIRAIASTWFEDGMRIMPLLKHLFGDR